MTSYGCCYTPDDVKMELIRGDSDVQADPMPAAEAEKIAEAYADYIKIFEQGL